MIKRTSIIQNVLISVAFCQEDDVVSIATNEAPVRSKLFAGFPDLKEAYEAFQHSFSIKTTFDDAVKFFTPTTTININ